jgi:hypothetical protein
MSNTYKDLPYSALMAKAKKAGFTTEVKRSYSYTRFEVIASCPLAYRAALVGNVGDLLKQGALNQSKNGGSLQGIRFIDIHAGRKGYEAKSKLGDLLQSGVDGYLFDAVDGYEKWGIRSAWVDSQLRRGIHPRKEITIYVEGFGNRIMTAPKIATTVCVAEYLYSRQGAECGDSDEYLRSLPEGLAARMKPHYRDKNCDYCIENRRHSSNVRLQGSADQLEELAELGIVPVVPVRW